MFEQINEPIEVIVVFRQSRLIPYRFYWQGRIFLIKKVNLTYSSWEGRNKVYYFAVTDDCNYFKLKFNTDSLSWVLLESYVE